MTSTKSTHQCLRIPLTLLLLNGESRDWSHSSSAPKVPSSSTNTSTSADIGAALHAYHLQTQSSDEIAEHGIFQNHARIEKPLYRS